MSGSTERSASTAESAARIRAEERMRLWTSVLEQSAEGIMICDRQERIVAVNAAFERLTGFSEQQVIGKTPRVLHSDRQDKAFYAAMWHSIRAFGRWSGEIWNRRRDGESYAEWLTVTAVCDSHGAVTHYVGTFSDLTAQKALQSQARRLAEYDSLTQLPNRTLLTARLEQLIDISRHTPARFAVLFVDLDRFDNINDSMGHDAGDVVLQTISRRIVSSVRTSDTVARVGADEFVVVVPELRNASDAASVTHKILFAIRRPISVSNQEIAVSASIGICLFPGDGAGPDDLVRNAAAANHRAKLGGGNAYECYTREMNERAAEKLRIENELRLALERREFELHYQPQVDIASGQIVGAEALLRWNRPGVGLVMPAEFIPIAEERGLIVSLGGYVVTEVIAQIQAWDALGLPPVTIAFNLSAGEFHRKGFVAELTGAIRRGGIAPARLELELTESIAVQDVRATTQTLDELHRLGVRLALDDFGTGYSCLSYLRHFPIDKIKIDQSFVRELAEAPESVRLVRAIVGLARSFGMKVTAEGVETREQLEVLRDEGCGEIQGYLASAGLPATEFQRLLVQRERFLETPDSERPVN